MKLRALVLSLLALGVACAGDEPLRIGPPVLTAQTSGVEASLRGVAVRDERTAWASGTDGTVLKTADAGATWERVAVPGGEALDFRDVQLLGESTVLLMSAGSGERSRVYRSSDAGASWELVLQNAEEDAFYNGFAFWDETTGLLTSDSFDGKPYFLKTEDGGTSWRRAGEGSLPPLVEDEYGFAASGTLIAAAGARHVWAATGGGAARVFLSADAALTWEVHDTPLGSGTDSSGIFSIAFRDESNGVAVGGDYKEPDADRGNAAWTDDGGKTWTASTTEEGGMPHKACVVHLGDGKYLAAGRTGLAFSADDGKSWETTSTESYYAIGYHAASGVGWLVGTEGRIARFTVRRNG